MHLQHMNCCAVSELSYIQYELPSYVARYVWAQRKLEVAHKAFYIFTAVEDKNVELYGEELASYIKSNRLGTVTKTPTTRRNPNSGNNVRVYTWSVSWLNLNRLAKKLEWTV